MPRKPKPPVVPDVPYVPPAFYVDAPGKRTHTPHADWAAVVDDALARQAARLARQRDALAQRGKAAPAPRDDSDEEDAPLKRAHLRREEARARADGKTMWKIVRLSRNVRLWGRVRHEYLSRDEAVAMCTRDDLISLAPCPDPRR